MKKIFFCLFFLIFSFQVFSQELKIGLTGNAEVNYWSNIQNTSNLRIISDTIPLPFFDDFSNTTVFPDQSKWIDNYVFINNTFVDTTDANLPPSIGVATFDAIDSYGKVYDKNANFFVGDTLTSKSIKLKLQASDSVYFSFFYQPQGIADAPEKNDSLVLEFWSPIDTAWYTRWSVIGKSLQPFKQVMIPIKEGIFLADGFRFRFKNYVSLAPATMPSLRCNGDQWNVDYIRLGKNRNAADTILHDVTFLKPLPSVLIDYEAVPHSHFNINQLKSKLPVTYRNNDNTSRIIDSLQIVFTDLKGDLLPDSLKAGSKQVEAQQTVVFNSFKVKEEYAFQSNSVDSSLFNVECSFKSDVFDASANNSISRKQRFYNYYAYDDGSAEAGYGLVGEGTRNASVAYRFTIDTPDTLRAVNMYFNHTFEEYNAYKYFYLMVWDNSSNRPNTILLDQIDNKPEFGGQPNEYQIYKVADTTTVVVSGTFYVGWRQTTEDFLNVGLDLNTDASENLFYNIDGTWQQSSIRGAIMFRPVFGKPIPSFVTDVKPVENSRFTVYPNPARETITIQCSENQINKNTPVTIYDTFGKIIFSSKTFVNSIDIRNFANDIYILKIGNQTRKMVKTW